MNYFVFGINNTQASTADEETAGSQNDCFPINSGWAILDEIDASHYQVIERIIANRVSEEVNSVVAAVENSVHEAILTAMEGVFVSRVEKALRSITGPSWSGPNNVVQNPGQKDFSGSLEDTPLIMASSCTDLNINNNENNETQSSDNNEDGTFPTLKSNFDQQKYTHHVTQQEQGRSSKRKSVETSKCWKGPKHNTMHRSQSPRCPILLQKSCWKH